MGALLLAALVAALGARGWSKSQDKFDHARHASLFQSCDGCHAVEPAGVSFPQPSLCQACHNGQVARVVDWRGPSRAAKKFGFNHAEAIAAKRELGEEVSCSDCHIAPGGGLMDVRRAPASHTPFFAEQHRSLAAATTAECEICHNRDQTCLGCHIGAENLDVPARDQGGYHPADFLEQHATAAWNRQVECSSCHNPEAFCRSCHAGVGRDTEGRTATGYHNEDPNFVFGHGQAARQALESCASCHAQQDCLACHSAKFGRNVNPHGPDFDAEKLRDKNPELCLICHFSDVLDRPF
jgi:hypothetical protein